MFEVRGFKSYAMKVFVRLVLIAWLMPTDCLADDWTITADGYGPVHAGMSIKEAEKLLHTRLQTDSKEMPMPECDFVHPQRGHKGLSFMVEHGVITHVQAHDKHVATDSGVRVGDSAAKLKKIYGSKIEKMPHVYYPGDFYYFVWEDGKERGIKFEVVGNHVLAIYGGSKSIMFVEGCD